MRRHSELLGLCLFVAATAIVTGAIVTGAAPSSDERMPHERKVVAGLAVVFGAEPEPALTEERQFLRWRVSSLADEEAYEYLEDAEVTIKRNGEEFGPFGVRAAIPASTRHSTSSRKPASMSPS